MKEWQQTGLFSLQTTKRMKVDRAVTLAVKGDANTLVRQVTGGWFWDRKKQR